MSGHAGFEVRYLSAGQLVKGVVAIHALSIEMPRLFPPDVLLKISTRGYVLPLRQRQTLEREISWLLDHMAELERKWVLSQPFVAKTAEKAGNWVRL